MRIAIISDIHSNLPALEAVLHHIDTLSVDAIYCLGDIVGYGPFPNECVELVRNRCRLIVKGNHDSGLIGETPMNEFNEYGQAALRWTTEQISVPNAQFLAQLPFTNVTNGITLVHASPHEPKRWHYVVNRRTAEKCFKEFSTPLCFIGHTHVPLIIGEETHINKFTAGGRFVINVGSVGQPRDGNPQSAFGLLDQEKKSYSLVRVPYDIQKATDAFEKAGLPSFLGKRLSKGI